jgi:hypothetical protein
MRSIPSVGMLLGIAFLVVCGLKISSQLGFEGLETGYVIGFAIGISLMARAGHRADLKKRLEALECKAHTHSGAEATRDPGVAARQVAGAQP